MAIEKETIESTTSKKTSTSSKKEEMSETKQGMGVFSLLSGALKCSVMSQEAEAHLEDLQKKLAQGGVTTTRTQIPFDQFEVVVLSSIKTKLGVALLYSENFNPQAIKSLVEVKQEIQKKVGNVSVIQPILVFPVDYPKVPILARQIQFMIGFDREEMRKNILDWTYVDHTKKDNIQFVVTNKPSLVRDVVNRLSPHSVPARCDYGIAVYITSAKEFYYEDKNNINYNKMEPIMAVTAYNRFIVSPKNRAKYIPIVTISEIVSALPDPGLMIIGLQFAIDRFVMGQDWLSPYRNFDPKAPNLGTLTLDPETGKMGFVKNEEEKIQLVENLFEDVWCSLDHVTGRLMIPGMERFDPMSGGETQASSRKFVSDFLGIAFENTPNIVNYSFEGTCGYVVTPGSMKNELMDSRNIDFMKMAAGELFNFNSIAFLLQPVVPHKQMSEFINAHYTYSELFIHKNYILDPNSHKFIREYMKTFTVFLDVENRELVDLNLEAMAAFNMSATSTNYGSGSIGRTSFGTNQPRTPIWD